MHMKSIPFLLGALLILWQGSSLAAVPIAMDPPVQAADAATPWQWIGWQNDTQTPCPEPAVDTWTVANLFVPAAGGGVVAIPPALRPFCLYTYQTLGEVPGPDLAALQALVPTHLSALEMDLLAVAPAGAVDDELWPDFEEHFLAQAGAEIAIDPAAAATHLSVVDTAETDHSQAHLNRGSSPHGATLINLARALLCADGLCAAKITSSLAMPFRLRELGDSHEIVRDTVHGGLFGSVAEVARGVQHEVARWTQLPNDHRLVLNLSLGWDAVFGGGEPTVSGMPLAVQAAYRATFDARCRGALVIAAAGNDPGGPTHTGPIYPAAWEQRPAPGRAACGNVLGYTPPQGQFPNTPQAYHPMVYAAAGVQANGVALANQRSGAGAPLTAFADHATVEGPMGQRPTAVLTGSSVASLVVSSAAALVWHHLPRLRADQVMEYVYQSADDLGRAPDFGLTTGSAAPRTVARRVSLCAAQQHACSLAGTCFVPPMTCPAWDPTRLDIAALFSVSEIQNAPRVDLTTQVVETLLPGECDHRTQLLDVDAMEPLDPCPDRQFRNLKDAPWKTDPQPGSTFCPSCPLSDAQGSLVLETDTSDPTAVWFDPVLVLCDISYPLDVTSLSAGEVLVVDGINLNGCDKAWISATTDQGSVTSPLLIGGP